MSDRHRESGRKMTNETRVAPRDDDDGLPPDEQSREFVSRTETRIAPQDADDDVLSDEARGFVSSNETRVAPQVDETDPRRALLDETRPAPIDILPNTGEHPVIENRTTFSSQAVLFADALRHRFAHKMYGRSKVRWILRVDEPEGPSTAGGLLARQPLSLVDRKGLAPSLVCGWMDVAKREAQLRSYQSVARRHLAHHNVIPDLSEKEFDRFIEDLVEALASGGMVVRVLVPDDVDPVPAAAPAPPARKSGISTGAAILLMVLAFLLGLMAGQTTRIVDRVTHRSAAKAP